jgi:hypothetical protein
MARFRPCAIGAHRAWITSPNPPDAGSSFNRNRALAVAKRIERALRGEPIDAIGCPSGVQLVELATVPSRTQPRVLAAASPSDGGLSGLERRALFVFVG